MGDTTNANITVYYCPPEQVKAVLGIIEDYFGGNDFGNYDGTDKMLELGQHLGAWDVSAGNVDEASSTLMDQAPGAAWYAYDEPKYEWMGSLEIYHPLLGHFGAQCDADGDAQFNVHKVEEIIALETHAERRRALGLDWDEALSDLLPPEGQRLLPALPECPTCGDWWGETKGCKGCNEVLTEREAKAQFRVIVDHLPDSDLCYVVARPSAIVWECSTCADASTLSHRHEVKVVGFAQPTEAETHKAHKGFGIGAGSHKPEDMRIKEVVA